MSASRGFSSNRDGFDMARGEAGPGTGRVVDLSQEPYIATEQRNYKTLPDAEGPRGTSAPASSGASHLVPSQLGAADLVSHYAKSSTWLPDGSVDYDYASASVMCSPDGLALVRVAGEIDHCTAPKLTAAVNEALSEGSCSIFVDLAEVTFFSAAGAMALLGGRRQCQRRGARFVLLRPSRPARRVLAFTDLLKTVIDVREKRPAR